MKYAQNTEVSVDKSLTEIERTLTRYKATGFSYGWQNNMAVISFEMNERRIAFFLPLPDKSSKDLKYDGRGTVRSVESLEKVYEQACRQRWRALALAVKAKLEAVNSKIATFEEEFLAHIVLPNGKTVGNMLVPQVSRAYLENKMPPLLGYNQ